MEQKKSTLKEIKATVMPQTAEGLQMLMEETGLTIGEVIDRLTLQMCPDDLGFAVCFAQDQVFFSISSLPEEEQEEALTKIIIFLAGLVPVDHLKGLDIDKQQKLDTIGTMFASYPYKQDFILYGELDIFRVTSNLSIQWQFSGKDIFVSYNDDAPAFEMKSDRIYLRDFEGDHYEIDYDGKLIQTLKHEKRRWTAWAHAISRYLKNHFNISHG